jgi:hypothetical protein
MDLQEALRKLPPAYAMALSLEERGVPREVIADQLSVHPDAIDTFFAVAQSKLAELQASTDEEAKGDPFS